MNDNSDEPLEPHEVASYVSDVVTQLAVMAHDAGLTRTAVALTRVEALAKEEVLKAGRTAPDESAS